AHPLALPAAVGLAGLLEAVAFHVEEPAVVAAADAAVLHPAVVERGPAMRAAGGHETGAPLSVAEEHQVLAQDAQRPRRVGGVADQADRVPVATQQLAHRRAGTHEGQLADERRPGPTMAGAGVGHGAFRSSPGPAGGAGSLERRRSSVGTPPVSTLLSAVRRVMRVMWLIMSAICRTARSPRSK